jgi:hypothetical protein
LCGFTGKESTAKKSPRHHGFKKRRDGVALTLAHPGGGRVTVSLKAAEAGRLIEELRNALESGS